MHLIIDTNKPIRIAGKQKKKTKKVRNLRIARAAQRRNV